MMHQDAQIGQRVSFESKNHAPMFQGYIVDILWAMDARVQWDDGALSVVALDNLIAESRIV